MTTFFGELAGDLSGTDDGRPPLVLVHGLTFDRASWHPALAALEPLDPGRRVLSLDLPGHGDSPPQPSYRMEETVARVHAAVEHAGLVAPVLVGHSIGGVIATVYAVEHPVTGVVNVDQSLQVEPFAAQLQSIAGVPFDQVWPIFWASMEIDRLPEEAQRLLEERSTPTAELVLGYWADLRERPEEMVAWARQGRAALHARQTPYEVVFGRPSDVEREWFARELPHAVVTDLPGCGHFPQLAEPEVFAERLAATTSWAQAPWSVPVAAVR
ncbi:MAG TPA: alpha/beta hydrolase [Gaiellaceae bacterium]|nr:alpha/beta hydrolase [Gaiellaceae bacterium]